MIPSAAYWAGGGWAPALDGTAQVNIGPPAAVLEPRHHPGLSGLRVGWGGGWRSGSADLRRAVTCSAGARDAAAFAAGGDAPDGVRPAARQALHIYRSCVEDGSHRDRAVRLMRQQILIKYE